MSFWWNKSKKKWVYICDDTPSRRPTRYYRGKFVGCIARNRCGHWEDRYLVESAWHRMPSWSETEIQEHLIPITKAQAEKKLKIKL